MAAITIRDLRTNTVLDRQAMSCIRGAGASWVYGWIRPYIVNSNSAVPVINFYMINNYADQMINQFQIVDVNNTAPNSTVTVAVDERSTNNRF